jgi:hypothetical protein
VRVGRCVRPGTGGYDVCGFPFTVAACVPRCCMRWLLLSLLAISHHRSPTPSTPTPFTLTHSDHPTAQTRGALFFPQPAVGWPAASALEGAQVD